MGRNKAPHFCCRILHRHLASTRGHAGGIAYDENPCMSAKKIVVLVDSHIIYLFFTEGEYDIAADYAGSIHTCNQGYNLKRALMMA